MKTLSIVSLAALFSLALAPFAFGQAGGHLAGKFIYDGDAPKQPRAVITKDIATCAKHGVLKEDLVVSKDGGIKNVLVYLYVGPGEKAPEIHAAYAKTKGAKVQFDNAKCRFEPHICLLRTDQTLVLGNKDTIGHNSKINSFEKPINPLIPAGRELEEKFTVAESRPVQVSCSIHGWMTGWMLIQDHPYMAASGDDGSFKIENIPPGTYTFQFWQEAAGYITEPKVDGKQVEWTRGRVEFTIKDGATLNLGEIRIAPAAFEK